MGHLLFCGRDVLVEDQAACLEDVLEGDFVLFSVCRIDERLQIEIFEVSMILRSLPVFDRDGAVDMGKLRVGLCVFALIF